MNRTSRNDGMNIDRETTTRKFKPHTNGKKKSSHVVNRRTSEG